MAERPDVLYAPFVWQETGVDHHDTLSGPVQVIFAHGAFLAKKVPRDENGVKQLRRLAHNLPNCVLPEFIRIYGTVTMQPSGTVRAVLTELCPLTLHEFIHQLYYQPSREVLTSMVLDIGNAILYLHQHNMLHGDLVPSAILVTTNCNCKIGDLGAPPAPNNVYTAPEVKCGGTPTPKSDVYSFGVTIAELATGLPPGKVELGDIIDDIDWEPLRSLVIRCIQEIPDARPELKEVVEETKKILASLSVPTPYNLTEFKRTLCDSLKEKKKLMFFPDLYWSVAMGQEDASAARAEAIPLQMMLENRVTTMETEMGQIKLSVECTESKLQDLEAKLDSVKGGAREPVLPDGRTSPGSLDTILEPPLGTPVSAPPGFQCSAQEAPWDRELPAVRRASSAEATVRSVPATPSHALESSPAPNGYPASLENSTSLAFSMSVTSSSGSIDPASTEPGPGDELNLAACSSSDVALNTPTVKLDRTKLQVAQPDALPWLRIPPAKDAAIQYAETVDEEFSCSLCWEVMENAACLTRCGHSFCQACLKRALQRKAECPTCRQQGEDCVPNFTLRKLICSLTVRCTNEGCNTTMPRSELESHMQRCRNAPHRCNLPSTADRFDVCQVICSSEEQQLAHRQQCDYIPVLCPHGCGAQFSAKLLSIHEQICSEVTLHCDSCQAELTRTELAEHLCPKEEIQCDLCYKMVMRGEMASHMEAAANDHVGQLMSILAMQNKMLKELNSLVKEQRTQLEDQSQRISAMSTKLPQAVQASVVNNGGSLRVTWHAQMQKSYSLYESPVFQCQGYSFSARLCRPPATAEGVHVRARSGSVIGQDMYGLYLRSLNDVGVIVQWGITCGSFRGKYSHFFQEKNSEAGTDNIILGMDGQRLVVEMSLRITNVILEGGDRKSVTLEKYHDKRRRRAVLEPGNEEDSVTYDRPPGASVVTVRSPAPTHGMPS